MINTEDLFLFFGVFLEYKNYYEFIDNGGTLYKSGFIFMQIIQLVVRKLYLF